MKPGEKQERAIPKRSLRLAARRLYRFEREVVHSVVTKIRRTNAWWNAFRWIGNRDALFDADEWRYWLPTFEGSTMTRILERTRGWSGKNFARFRVHPHVRDDSQR